MNERLDAIQARMEAERNLNAKRMFGMDMAAIKNFYDGKSLFGEMGNRAMRAGSVLSDAQQLMEFAEQAFNEGNFERGSKYLNEARQLINVSKFGIFEYWSDEERKARGG